MKPGVLSAVRRPAPCARPQCRGSIGKERIGERKRVVRRKVIVDIVEGFVVDVRFEDVGILVFERRIMILLF